MREITAYVSRYVCEEFARQALDQAVLQSQDDGFGARVHLKLFVDIADVKIYGMDRNSEFDRRRFVVVPLNIELEQAGFVRRQVVFSALRWAVLAKQRDDAAGNFRG